MLACSILFFWELGKHCVKECICLRRSGPSVASVRADDETQLERRLRRQDAVRRAVEREATEHLFAGSTLSRTTEGDSTSVPPPSPAVQASSHVHLHVSPISGSITDPNPAASSPLSSSRLFPRMSGSSTSEGLPPGPPPPPPPFRESGTGYTRREGARSVTDVGVQTVGPQGLTDEQLCEMEVITSSARTPGVVHLFPDCHALRTVSSTNRRSFCRYCLMNLRQRGLR